MVADYREVPNAKPPEPQWAPAPMGSPPKAEPAPAGTASPEPKPAFAARPNEPAYARMAPEERVRICSEMFDTACALAEASLPENLDPAERRYRLCERLYGELAARAFPRAGD